MCTQRIITESKQRAIHPLAIALSDLLVYVILA
jgi:hypothetical protein